VVYGLSASHLAKSPVKGRVGLYYKRLAQMSAAFAAVSDLALMILGGGLKRREKISGRFADALGYMYYTSAILKKFEDDGRPRADLPLVEYSAKYCLHQVQVALDEILRNFPLKWVGLAVRVLVFPLGSSLRPPNDSLGHRVAAILLKPGEARDRLTRGLFIGDAQDITGRLEATMARVIEADPIEKRLRAQQLVKPDLVDYDVWVNQLLELQHISAQEAELLKASREATREVIMVDEFAPHELESARQPAERVA
jgi:acyl-CoA dehydrogenase